MCQRIYNLANGFAHAVYTDSPEARLLIQTESIRHTGSGRTSGLRLDQLIINVMALVVR